MTLGDFEVLATPRNSTNFAALDASGKFISSFMAGTESLLTRSQHDAPKLKGKFPLVIYAPSVNAPAIENIELCEYLASRGFVVVASASLGADETKMTVDDAGARTQGDDIRFLLTVAHRWKNVDVSRTAVIGYSWGGTAALVAAEEDTSIRALVSLDGSFRYGLPPQFARKLLDIPLLLFTRGETPLLTLSPQADSLSPESALLKQFQGPIFQYRLLAISHIQFSTLYQRSERFKNEGSHFVPGAYTLQDGSLTYSWMARYIAEFLDFSLNGDVSAREFLIRTPEANGAPANLIQAGKVINLEALPSQETR